MDKVTQFTSPRLGRVMCYRANLGNSSGVFLGDRLMQTSVPLLLTQIVVIYATTRITHAVLRPIGISQVFSQVIAGLILGPSFLSRNDTFRNLLFPMKNWVNLNMIALLSFTLFTFGISVKTDMSMMYKSGKKPIALAFIAGLIPYTFHTIFTGLLVAEKRQILIISGRWVLNSNTVMVCLLEEFNLLNSKLGRLAMSACLIIDLGSMLQQTMAYALVLGAHMTPQIGMSSFASFCAFIGLIFFGARPLALWLIRRTPEGEPMDPTYFVTVLILAAGTALAGEVVGQHYTIGPIILGLLLPGGAPLGTTLSQRMDGLVTELFLPLYLATTGFKMDIGAAIRGSALTKPIEFAIAANVTVKSVGVFMFGIFFRMQLREIIVLVLMMNCRGLMEMNSFSNLQESQVLPEDIYTLNMIAMILVGGVGSALLRHLYRPSMRFLAYTRRTIQHTRRNDELRILLCVHNRDNVTPLISLLEISNPAPDAPISAYLLHLSQLIGRTAPILTPYKQKKRRRGSSKSHPQETDQIINAFRFLEQHMAGRLYIIPFICIAPYASMHEDICTHANKKKVTLIVLPFHKHYDNGGTIQSVNPAIQAMNINTLTYAPCSIAILVDNGLSGGPSCPIGTEPLHRVVAFFLGGSDDREALAYATRIAQNDTVALTVVRFLLAEDARSGGGGGPSVTREELSDEEAVEEFQAECMDNKRVDYKQEYVRDGAETVGVIREMCGNFNLVIVGRRQGLESPLTTGLDMWSEYPELGLLGDFLASTDFGRKVSTMVVQQQAALVGGAASTAAPSRL